MSEKKSKPSVLRRALLPAAPFVIIVVATQCAVSTGLIPPYILPAPGDVARSFAVDIDELSSASLETAAAAFMGLGLSFILGLIAAVLLSWSRFAKDALYPYAVFFQTVPVVSIAPLLVIWFGFGMPTTMASACLCSFFAIVANTLAGFEATDQNLLDLFRIYRAPKWKAFVLLRFPFAWPQILTGLRVASGLAVIGAIVGEFIAGGGLGGVIDAARTQQKLDKVFAAVLLSSLLGLLFVQLISLLSYLTLRHWHASETSKRGD